MYQKRKIVMSRHYRNKQNNRNRWVHQNVSTYYYLLNYIIIIYTVIQYIIYIIFTT